jgi:hypothetical protein
MWLIRDLYVSGIVQFILTVFSAIHLVVYWSISSIFLELCTLSGKFLIPYKNIGGGVGTLEDCDTSTAMDSLVVGSRALYLLCSGIISGHTCDGVTYLRFVDLTTCQLFSVDSVPSPCSLENGALGLGWVKIKVHDELAEHEVCCWFCKGRSAVSIWLEDWEKSNHCGYVCVPMWPCS